MSTIKAESVDSQDPNDHQPTESSFEDELKAALPKDLSIEYFERNMSDKKKKQNAEIRARNRVQNLTNPVEATELPDMSGEYSGEDYLAAKQLESMFTYPEALSSQEQEAIKQLEETLEWCANKTHRKLLFQADNSERETYSSVEAAQAEQLKPFINQLRYLLCRFVRQQAKLEGQPPSQDLDYIVKHLQDLAEMLNEVPGLVEDVYATDIPLYQKVYDRFDKLRRDEEPIEVYLARDGIFAYYGRRAQAAVRNQQADEEFVPKYQALLFNRRMAGTFTDEDLDFDDFSDEQQERMTATQRQYLQQEGIEGNVHFFDTGYVGTIPEHIMKLMGFSSQEIDDHIHLLSADDRGRRSKGLRVNHPRAVDSIEHERPKLTKSATGFTKEDDVVSVAAEPSEPKDIFYSLIIREAVHRHFWLTEKHRQD